MSKKINIKPTEAELEILQILWEHGESTVRYVNELLNKRRRGRQKEIGYTTTLKLMQLMHEKGLASRNEEKRTHIYTAKVRENEMQKALLDKFVDKTFRGAAMKMVMQTLGNHKTSQKELDEIKALIATIENKK